MTSSRGEKKRKGEKVRDAARQIMSLTVDANRMSCQWQDGQKNKIETIKRGGRLENKSYRTSNKKGRDSSTRPCAGKWGGGVATLKIRKKSRKEYQKDDWDVAVTKK